MKKAFTLVELLAVIVILGTLLTITVFNGLKILDNSTQKSYDNLKNLIEEAAKIYVDLNDISELEIVGTTYCVTLKNLYDEGLINLPVLNPKTGTEYSESTCVYVLNKDEPEYFYYFDNFPDGYDYPVNLDTISPVITILGDNPFTMQAGETYVDSGVTAIDNVDGDITSNVSSASNLNPDYAGTYSIIYTVLDSSNNIKTATRTIIVVAPPPYYASDKGVNKPMLATGMTPIKWNGSTWVDTIQSDSDWYDYSTTSKKWANARTNDGSFWVWIPRYAYQISTNYHTRNAGNINIKFLMNLTNDTADSTPIALTPTYSGSSQTNYVLHPAFTFGIEEIPGIWVAKFLASNDGSGNVEVKPNVTSYASITINNQYNKTREMRNNTAKYGWNATEVDTFMHNDYTWGAVGYLSKSSYGKSTEVWINPNSNYITGCAGTSANASNTTACNQYSTANGMQSSTTGNIYGIYDTGRGGWESMSTYVNNGDSYLNNGLSILSADSKYKVVYAVGTTDDFYPNYEANNHIFGNALWETSSTTSAYYLENNAWYSEYSNMITQTGPWMYRGGGGTTYGGLYSFQQGRGQTSTATSFRPIVVVLPK